MRATLAALFGLALLAGAAACGPTSDQPSLPDGGSSSQDDAATTACSGDDKRCDYTANAFQTCQAGAWHSSPCSGACDPTLGCVTCQPNGWMCQGQDVVQCDAQGRPGAVIAHCQGTCARGACDDPCGQAEANKSYLGCDYWPTVTMNSVIYYTDLFNFAVAVANTGTADALVTVTGGGLPAGTPTHVTVTPGALQTIKLPWVDDLRQSYGQQKSVQVTNGAYHLTSTQPVTVYQFNALEYKAATTLLCTDATCDSSGTNPTDGCENNVCVRYSYSNDASLLLPRHVLADDTGKSTYIVLARPTMERYVVASGTRANQWSPGFFAVVATEDDTTVDLNNVTANTIAGVTGSGLVSFNPGASGTFTLNQGDVLMIASDHQDSCTGTGADSKGYIHCNLAQGYDLTGTEIASDKAVAVFGGHDCEYVPFSKLACDHLEQQLFPVTAWGKHYVATKTTSSVDPNLYRVLSGHDGNTVTLTPPIQDAITGTTLTTLALNKGEWVELITDQDFELSADLAFMVAAFMVGQNYSNPDPGAGAPGDPSMCLVVPSEQFRTQYTFLAPDTYEQNYVNVVAATGSNVSLDGTPITGWQQIGAGVWNVVKLQISGGAHTITTDGTTGFGIQVYGVGSYTSYMFPGGLDVKPIDIPG